MKSTEELIGLAQQAREEAYAPYSGFKVGAALESKDGQVYLGCNIEIVGYAATCCAERTAVFKAVSEGARSFSRIAIIGDTPEPITPCGVCRQTLSEFLDEDTEIVMTNLQGDVLIMSMKEILPVAFKRSADFKPKM